MYATYMGVDEWCMKL